MDEVLRTPLQLRRKYHQTCILVRKELATSPRLVVGLLQHADIQATLMIFCPDQPPCEQLRREVILDTTGSLFLLKLQELSWNKCQLGYSSQQILARDQTQST